MEIEKGKPIRIFAEEEGEWKTLDLQQAFKVAEALADPTRQWIYQVLENGPFRQAELAKKASDFFKKKITNVLMRYHLNKLSEAGLVRFGINPGPGRVKMVYRASDLRVQLRQSLSGATPENLSEELTRIFRRS
ncbi:MAG: helix-turn-helix domain-containing protein [Candidatus Hadarchaeales archaeon]